MLLRGEGSWVSLSVIDFSVFSVSVDRATRSTSKINDHDERPKNGL
jgi:hypothetical protein